MFKDIVNNKLQKLEYAMRMLNKCWLLLLMLTVATDSLTDSVTKWHLENPVLLKTKQNWLFEI